MELRWGLFFSITKNRVKKKRKKKGRAANARSSFYKDGNEGAGDVRGLTPKIESLRLDRGPVYFSPFNGSGSNISR